MPYPVLPPTPPAIVEVLPLENPNSPALPPVVAEANPEDSAVAEAAPLGQPLEVNPSQGASPTPVLDPSLAATPEFSTTQTNLDLPSLSPPSETAAPASVPPSVTVAPPEPLRAETAPPQTEAADTRAIEPEESEATEPAVETAATETDTLEGMPFLQMLELNQLLAQLDNSLDLPEPLSTPTPTPIPAPEPVVPGPPPREQIPESPPAVPPANGTPPDNPPPFQLPPQSPADVIELNADRQEFNTIEQVFRAEGRVNLRFRGATLTADRLQVNLENRLAVADGNTTLTRGAQTLRGDRLEYNLTQDEGTVIDARGELFLPSAGADFGPSLPTDIGADTVPNTPVGGRVAESQPLQVQGSPGQFTFGVNTPNQRRVGRNQGDVRRLRYEADRVDFAGGEAVATNVRLTNDPFSPPELEIRTRRLEFNRLSPTQSELRARNPRIVFDQGFSLPLLRDRVVFDNRERSPGLVTFGFDQDERGGLFVEREFDVVTTDAVSFSVTPQIYLQRGFDEGVGASTLGLRSRLNAQIDPRTSFTGNVVLTSLDLGDVEDSLRASLRARRQIGDHTLALEYSYRDRLFNGSLGFQNVQSSLGFVLTSPIIPLGDSGINLSYQAGVNFINANTDRQDLLEPGRDNDRINLTRYQTSVALNRSFLLWTGTPLPPTREAGLRYTPNPITPYVALSTGVRGVVSAYSNGDTQSSLTGSIGLSGQFGRSSRDFLDYTAFNIFYSLTALDGESPFTFDRVADRQVLTLGITQQVYGPFRVGVQTSLNLDEGREIDTTYSIEYSRRTYGITLSYSPVREAAAIGFRISDFNWTGDPGPFSGLGAEPVSGGVRRETE